MKGEDPKSREKEVIVVLIGQSWKSVSGKN